MDHDPVTGREFEEILTKINSLPRIPDEFRAGNFLDLRRLLADVWPSRPEPLTIRSAWDLYWLFRCELLFVEGLYGPCCIWARATVEYELQELVLTSEKTSEGLKNRILRNGYNPKFDDYLKELGPALSAEAHKGASVVKENGDFIVHHRLDKIVGTDATEWLKYWGVPPTSSDAQGELLENRFYGKVFRFNHEEELALESMKSLYIFEAHSRPKDGVDDDQPVASPRG